MNCKICNVSIIRQEGIYLESRKPNDFKKDYENEIFICTECNKYPLSLIKAFTSDGEYLLSLNNGVCVIFTSAKYIDRQWMQIQSGVTKFIELNGFEIRNRAQVKIEDVSLVAEGATKIAIVVSP